MNLYQNYQKIVELHNNNNNNNMKNNSDNNDNNNDNINDNEFENNEGFDVELNDDQQYDENGSNASFLDSQSIMKKTEKSKKSKSNKTNPDNAKIKLEYYRQKNARKILKEAKKGKLDNTFDSNELRELKRRCYEIILS